VYLKHSVAGETSACQGTLGFCFFKIVHIQLITSTYF